jgi:predicted enzyme related to lactoylglutathione lyase
MKKNKKEINSKMNPVVHFEMPYEKSERLIRFYTTAFGWQMQLLGKDMGEYVTASTTETDENRMVKRPGVINGGFYPKQSDFPSCPSFVISVENLKEAMEKVEKAGGKILGEQMEIPGIGLYVSFIDTEGNRVSLLQPKNM